MRASIKNLGGIMVICVLAVACTPKTPISTIAPPTEPPSPPTSTLAPTDEATEQVEPTDELLSIEGQRIEFESEDGVLLVGSYFPAMVNPAPTVILMHQAGSERGAWEKLGMVAWLQNRGPGGGALFAPALGASLWPPMPSGLSFAIFTFDFREHGESGGSAESGSDFLVDAKAAFQIVKGLDGVNPERIVMIGASIGADAAIDICVEGCLGSLSLSPGNYLDVSYAEVVAEMGLDGKPAWCLASNEDGFSASTCKAALGDTYRSIIFAEGGHGEALLSSGMDPDIGQVILDFLLLTFGAAPQG